MKITINQLRKIIKEEVESLSTPGSLPPNPQAVHDEFLMLRDEKGEVPLKMLAAGLGVEPDQIDWNGTGLRVINGVVTELLGGTPYRTDR